MKKSKVVVPALGLIALGVAASITGTVAWFTANNTVKIDGMTFNTEVGNTLFVAPDTANASFTDSAFKTKITQTRSAKLEPVSSIDGLSFYYTNVSNDNGTPKDDSPFYLYNESGSLENVSAGKTTIDPNFNTRYGFEGDAVGTSVYGYIDYTFYLKGTFTTAGDKIVMDKCNLLYWDASLETPAWVAPGATDLAWRVAVFKHAATTSSTDNITTVNTYTDPMADADRVTILSRAGTDYFYDDAGTDGDPDAVSALGAARAEGNAPTYADVKSLGNAATIYSASLANEKNKVFKVVVRLWLEGEDVNCFVDNYKLLTSNYKLDLSFKIEAAAGTSAVQNIQSNPAL